MITCRGVAQPGSVLAWGARGRVFESHRPDQSIKGSEPKLKTLNIANLSIGDTYNKVSFL